MNDGKHSYIRLNKGNKDLNGSLRKSFNFGKQQE